MAKRGQYVALGVLVVLALPLFVPPLLNVNRFRARITNSIGSALGRTVTVDAVKLRLVPQPGFDLENIQISDDPAISAEPFLTSEEVTAYLRLSSLWRGRLEIAKLSLRYPSVNIVRAPNGVVNVESLLWQASRTPVAPTSQRRPDSRPRFPYIEAESGRINFKRGLEKSVFSFNEADFALWSSAENEWRMRLEAKPVRTDASVTDTGVMRAEATFKRAGQLRDIPIEGRVQWQHGQLGQLSKLAYGYDRGWRGGLDVTTLFTGTATQLHIVSDIAVRDFRRYDVAGIDPLRLDAHCNGLVSLAASTVPGFDCRLPFGNGVVLVAGNLGHEASAYDVSVAAENVAVNDLLTLARHAKHDLPQDLIGQGTVVASASFRRSGPSESDRNWAGSGSASDLVFRSGVLGDPIILKRMQVVITTPGIPAPEPAAARKAVEKARRKRTANIKAANPKQPHEVAQAFLHILPAELGNRTSKTILSGSASATEYSLNFTGSGTIERYMQVARGIGIAVPTVNLLGKAEVDIDVHGLWPGLANPSVLGTAKLTEATAQIPGVAGPVEVASALVNFQGTRFTLSQILATVGKLKFSGSAGFERSCERDSKCTAELDLNFDDLDADQIDALANPSRKRRPWYRFFGSGNEESALPALSAHGRITADRLTLGPLAATHFTTIFELEKGNLKLEGVRADVFGGAYQGDWQLDFTGKVPAYAGKSALRHANMASLAALARQPLGTGTLDAEVDAKFAGWTDTERASSATVNADFTLSNGVLRTINAPGHAPWTITRFTGKAAFENGSLRFDDCRMATPSGSFVVNGTASSAFDLALQLIPEKGNSFRFAGTLNKPEITVRPESAKDTARTVQKKPTTGGRRL